MKVPWYVVIGRLAYFMLALPGLWRPRIDRAVQVRKDSAGRIEVKPIYRILLWCISQIDKVLEWETKRRMG